jgi:two-component system sensor histidine kinase KdpD
MDRRLEPAGASPLLGSVAGVTVVTVAVAVMIPLRVHVARATPALVLVAAVVTAALVGGAVAAVVTALAAALALNLAFIPPFWTLKVNAWDDWVALAVFMAVALVVGVLVADQAERRRIAEQREQELQRLVDRLRDLSAEREALVEEATKVEVLKRVDEQRSALLRSVSHDLRTPLATIRAVASDLRDGVPYEEATRAELLASVCEEAERLDRIVANLLSLSRIEAGALVPDRQAVALEELIDDRVRRLAGLFRHVRVQVDVAADLPYVDGDYSQLDQLLTNLLENASRYAPMRSTLWISARARDRVVEVRVADEGSGIPPGERTRVFEPFQRGEGGGSAGVGLALCKAIVDAHGGSLWVEPTEGGGATFAFTLPARVEAVVR